MSEGGKILVLYGSQTFTAQEIAERIWRITKSMEFRGPVLAMDEYSILDLIREEFAIFVCSTTGHGEEPDNMKPFWKFLLKKSLPSNSLVKLKYGVLGLGDSSYPKFNFAAKKLHRRLQQLGATPLLDIGLCDYQHDLGHEAVITPWTTEYFIKLKRFFPNIQTDNITTTKFTPRWDVIMLKQSPEGEEKKGFSDDIYFSKGNTAKSIDVKRLEIERNYRITDETHFQDVRILCLKTTIYHPLSYRPGDVFHIRPRNSPEDIKDLFDMFEKYGVDIKPHYRVLVEECHVGMPVPIFLQGRPTVFSLAEQYWDLKAYPTQYVFSLLAQISQDKLEREKCMELASPEGQEEWLKYSRRPKRTILEVLHDFHKTTSSLTIEVLFELFSSIKPRCFSIASSTLPTGGLTLDILVAVVMYYTGLKKPRIGLCSNWLKDLPLGVKVYGWIKKGSLSFPRDALAKESSIPNILVGPGTGLAPFRSMLQERDALHTATRHTVHLFFGCRHKEMDFHCREELEKMEEDGKLSLYCAFSRDQEEKVYVQHRMAEHRQMLWNLIQDENAHIFISGTSKNMPDDVREVFVEDVLGKIGGISLEEAKETVKRMEIEGKFQIETWS